MSWKDYNKNRAESFKTVLEETEKALNKDKATFEADPDDWYPGVDKAGNGLAIIRFLPPLENEFPTAYVKWFSHSFQDPSTKKWYIENSLKRDQFDKIADPVAEFNVKLWNSVPDGPEAKKTPERLQASRQKKILNHRANVYIISDSANPENNGKIKKFKFGKVILDFIHFAMFPNKVEGAEIQEEAWNPFDLVEGANFNIRIKTETVDGKPTRKYGNSGWSQRGPLATEKKMEAIYNELNNDPKWSLLQYVAPDKFKTFEDLKKRLDLVMGYDTATGSPLGASKTVVEAETKASVASEPKTRQTAPKASPSNEEKEDVDFFKDLREEDDIPF